MGIFMSVFKNLSMRLLLFALIIYETHEYLTSYLFHPGFESKQERSDAYICYVLS